MAKNKTYKLKFKRKRSGKTSYKKRLKLLSSYKPRVVIRKSSNKILAQIVEFKEDGDQILLSVDSTHIKKLGWKNHGGNIPCAYLVGLLIGKKALEKGIKKAIADTGFQKMQFGNRIYACIKGMIDAGLNVPSSEKVFPKEDRINGSHINKEIVEHFKEIKDKIIGGKQ